MGWPILDSAITRRSRKAVGPRLELHGIDDPELGDPEGRVEGSLAAEIVIEARVRHLDDQAGGRSVQAFNPPAFG